MDANEQINDEAPQPEASVEPVVPPSDPPRPEVGSPSSTAPPVALRPSRRIGERIVAARERANRDASGRPTG